jgi:hypothetical protein
MVPERRTIKRGFGYYFSLSVGVWVLSVLNLIFTKVGEAAIGNWNLVSLWEIIGATFVFILLGVLVIWYVDKNTGLLSRMLGNQ